MSVELQKRFASLFSGNPETGHSVLTEEVNEIKSLLTQVAPDDKRADMVKLGVDSIDLLREIQASLFVELGPVENARYPNVRKAALENCVRALTSRIERAGEFVGLAFAQNVEVPQALLDQFPIIAQGFTKSLYELKETVVLVATELKFIETKQL